MKAVCTKEGRLLIGLRGDVDHHRAPALREKIDEQMESLLPKELVLDFSQTEFMDSSGLGLILGRKERCDRKGVRLILLNPTDQILRILRLAGLEKALSIEFE